MRKKINKFFLPAFDILILSLSFIIIVLVKPAKVPCYMLDCWLPLTLFLIIWITVASLGNKYKSFKRRTYKTIFSSIITNGFIAVFIIALLIFGLKLYSYSRIVVLYTLGLTIIIEITASFTYYFIHKFVFHDLGFGATGFVTHSRALESEEGSNELLFKKREEKYRPSFCTRPLSWTVTDELKKKYAICDEKLFDFIEASIDLNCFKSVYSDVIDTALQDETARYSPDTLELLMNQHSINDIRRINEFLIDVNHVLKTGAVFIGCGQTLSDRRNARLKKYSRPLVYVISVFDFIFNRVVPKLDIFKNVYFYITKGYNRPLSKCEILGRLCYCGFGILATRELNGKLYFIVKKEKKPNTDPSPSYGPLFKMKRHGKYGKVIYIYKFRTMHPYAEYLQSYMVENYGYGEDGKIEDDFRTTNWGKILRRLWLDELPQLINLFKGELSLVGVRPLSERFLKEYPQDLLQERMKRKPGCIPPYVALRMQDVESYIESERIYLNEKKDHPLRTDIKYFFWATFNILTNRIRSA